MSEINYAKLAAQCERKAKAGVGPEIIGDPDVPGKYEALVREMFDMSCTFYLTIGFDTDTSALTFVRKHRMDSDGRLDGAGNLFLEALLRDATVKLHREAYEQRDALLRETNEQRAEMALFDRLRCQDQSGASVVENRLMELDAENQRLRLSNDTLQTDSNLMSEAMENLKRENQRLRTALEEIVKLAPSETPDAESAREGQNHDDIYAVGYDCGAYDCSVIASKALSPEASNG